MIGIYKITNLLNNKVYIGQSWDVERRFKGHRTQEHNLHLKNSMKVHGIKNFSFEVLLQIKEGPFTQRYLDKYEAYFGKMYDATNREKGYNIRDYGIGGRGGKLAPETLILIKEKCSGEGNGFYGKKHSENTRAKMSKAQSGEGNPNYGKKGDLSPIYGRRGEKMPMYGRTGIKNPLAKPVICVESGYIYGTVNDAAKRYQTDRSNIAIICRNNKEIDGIHLRYLQ